MTLSGVSGVIAQLIGSCTSRGCPKVPNPNRIRSRANYSEVSIIIIPRDYMVCTWYRLLVIYVVYSIYTVGLDEQYVIMLHTRTYIQFQGTLAQCKAKS